MSLQVACIACSRTFDAVAHAGLVRCRQCEEMQDFSLPSVRGNVITIDTPGEAWAS